MSILFDLPRVSAGNDFNQKGPTCWYYAAKMLVALHNLRSNADFEARWKALHEVRKVITELDEDSSLGGKPTEDLHWLRGRLRSTHLQHDALIHALDQAKDLPFGAHRDGEIMRCTAAIKQTLGIDPDKATRENAALLASRQHMDAATTMTRFDLLDRFMPGVFAYTNVAAADCTREWLETKLREVGPFYASGDVWSKSADRTVRTGTSSLVPVDTRVEVRQMAVDSAHAVVIVGLVNGMVFYKDPNDSSQVRFITFAGFVEGWGRDGSCAMIELVCPHRSDNWVGGCVHAVARIMQTPGMATTG